MNSRFTMDKATYATMLAGLDRLHFTEWKGNLSDFRLYYDNLWLSDTAVIENLRLYRGEWEEN